MLSSENRKDLIEDINENISFTFEEITPSIAVNRYGEGFKQQNPYILIEFLPANRPKFRSVSDVIGKATTNGQYKQYGYCQIEEVSLYCYAGEFHNENNVNGRDLVMHLADTVRIWILRNWEQLLWKMNASFDRSEDLNIIRDLSTYDPNTQSLIYCTKISFFLRTQVRWDKIPELFEGEEIVEKIGVFGKSTSEDEYEFIERIEVD